MDELLPTLEEYKSSIDENLTFLYEQWSKPLFKCPKCGGNVRKNLMIAYATYPPKSLYACDNDDYEEVF